MDSVAMHFADLEFLINYLMFAQVEGGVGSQSPIANYLLRMLPYMQGKMREESDAKNNAATENDLE